MIHINAPGIDTDAVIEGIHASVRKKTESGCYRAAGLQDTERLAPLAFGNNAAFLTFYLENLRENAFVDIGDFEIIEKRPRFSRLLITFKRAIWSLLRFYTFRLWSQQNQVNGLLLAAIEGIHDQQKETIAALEKRLAALERAAGQADGGGEG